MTLNRSEIEETHPVLAGRRTRALEVGGTGRAFILLHGFADHAGTWSGVLDELAAVGRRAVALDLPGYGEADPATVGPSLPQLDTFLAAAVERWTLDGLAPIVVGNSLGGVLAIRAGQDPNSAVAGVVPVSPAGFGHVWFIDLLEKYSWLNPLMFIPVVPMRTFRRLVASGYAWAARGPVRVLPGMPTAAAAHFRTRADVKRVMGSAPSLLTEIRNAPRSPITVPAMIIWGRHDRLTLVRGAEIVQSLAPGA
jgi:pimeloyl-ACP methyl ester carboxylesterase